MLLGALVGRRRWFKLSGRIPDLTPSLHWPKPVLVCTPSAEDGPVLVSVEYRVAPENQTAFIRAGEHVRRRRQRSGGYASLVVREPAAPPPLVPGYIHV